jgi:transposase
MDQPTVRKTYTYKLKPTPEQERELERVLGLCRYLSNTALEQRIIAYQRRRVTVSRNDQEAELKDKRAAFAECAAIHSHTLQDARARLDKTNTALALVRANDSVYHEDLQVRTRVQRHSRAKSVTAAGWAAFLTILSDKAACAGRSVSAVHPALTSQTCSGCGVLVSQGLSVRWRVCPECGTSLRRDHNAAKNIERLGLSLRGGVAVVAWENRASLGY